MQRTAYTAYTFFYFYFFLLLKAISDEFFCIVNKLMYITTWCLNIVNIATYDVLCTRYYHYCNLIAVHIKVYPIVSYALKQFMEQQRYTLTILNWKIIDANNFALIIYAAFFILHTKIFIKNNEDMLYVFFQISTKNIITNILGDDFHN